jgi:stage IV sporulation protein A
MLIEEFPAKETDITLPGWTSVLPDEHILKKGIRDAVVSASADMKRMRDIKGDFAKALTLGIEKAVSACGSYDDCASVTVDRMDGGVGKAYVSVHLPEGLYYDVISEMTGIPMKNEAELLCVLESLSNAKRELDIYKKAISDVNETGYGIVMPGVETMTLEEPEIIRTSGGYGVKLKASATSIHMIKTNINTEINPIVGTEQQSAEMVSYLMKEFEDDPGSIWQSNMFGKTLHELINESLNAKLSHMPVEARKKLCHTLGKIINDGAGGLICILL